jgi:hypothetical protein
MWNLIRFLKEKGRSRLHSKRALKVFPHKEDFHIILFGILIKIINPNIGSFYYSRNHKNAIMKRFIFIAVFLLEFDYVSN